MTINLFSKANKIFLLFVLLLTTSFINAATRTSTSTGGTWTTGATWLGGVAPVAGDNVIIATTTGNSVNLGASTSITNVTINAGATLNIANRTLTTTGFFTNNGTLSGTSGIVTLTGNFINNGTVTLTTGQVNISTGTFSNTSTGTFTLSTGRITTTAGNFSNAGTITYSGAGRLYLGGNFTNSGTFTLTNGGIVYFTGTANQSIQGFTCTGTVNMLKTGGTATLTSNVTSGGLTLNGLGGTLDLVSGTHTFNGTWTRTNGTLNCGSSLLRIGGSISAAVATFNAGTGTVEYYRAGNQTGAIETYNNLILSGSGTKTFGTTPTVNGKLTLAGTAIVTVTTGVVTYGPIASLQYDTTNVRTVTSEEWITPFVATGGIVINGTNNITLNTAKVLGLSSPLTITSIGKLLTNNLGLTFGGDFIINTGGTFTAGSAPIVIANTAATQIITGFTTTGLISMTKASGTATFGGNVGGAGLTINGGGILQLGGFTHTFTGAIALTSGTLNAGSSILNANFTGSAWTGTGSNFVSGTGTVNFGGAAQTLATASTFNNLTFSGSGIKTVTGLPTVNGILSMAGTATVSAAPTYGTAATLQYNRTATQASGPEWLATFTASGGVSIINTGVVTANAIKSLGATAPLNIAIGATLSNGGFAISGTTLTVADTATLLLTGTSFFPVFTTTNLALTSIVNYSGTAQTVAVQNYGNLILSGSGNKTFAGSTTIKEDLAINGSAVALFPNGSSSNSESLTLGGALQTTLGSWGGTGSLATNQNLTWFGATTTGILNVTTSCVVGTWLGLTNADWNTATNWCSNIIPTALTDVVIATSPNSPTIGVAGGLCKNITILSGATLVVSGSNTLTVSGNWINNGTFTPNTSTVNFNGSVAQTIGGSGAILFHNITNSNTAATVSVTKGITVNNSLNIANNTSVLDMATFILTDGGTFSNAGNGQLKTANTSSTPIPSGKTWNNTVFYSNTTGGQTIVAGTYNGAPALELDNTSGTQTASGVITTGGQLNMDTVGTSVLDMNGYNLTTNALNISDSNAILDMRGATLTTTSVAAMDGTVRFSGATNGKPFASGTVEYYGATQTVTSGNYYKLLFTGVAGIYTIATNLDVSNTLNVTNGAVTLQDGFTLSVGDAVTVVSPGKLTIENNASLLQTAYTGANVGDVIVKRNTTPILHLDDTYWSSPTTGTQTLLNFSPLTESDQFYTYDSTNDNYATENPATAVFNKGIGYIIRAPDNTSTTTPTVTPHQFVGVPNNGSFTLAVTTPPALTGLSLIGNPYPSAINANDFINENLYDATLNPTNTLQGTLYFWTHNNSLNGTDFSGDDYYFYNLSGGAGYGSVGTGNNTLPTGYIASGQGFFVENVIAGNLKFNNTMREQHNNSNFYKTKKNNKTKEIERHRIWLNLTNSAVNKGSQLMVGYIENATNNYEAGYDSFVSEDKPFIIYSLIGTDKMAIQGRGLPFANTDIVPLGYAIDVADNTTIAINNFDGLFIEDQGIYLEDKLLSVIHDIKSDPYVFASAAGVFNDRFVLRYTDPTLGTKAFDSLKNRVLVSNKNKQIKINSFAETIDKVVVYDLLGKLICQKTNVNTNELSITDLVSSHQTIVIKTTLQNGTTVVNKLIY